MRIYFYITIFILAILLFSCTTRPEECGLGFTDINGKCYNDNDIAVLQAFIDSSSATISMTWDRDSSGSVEPIELNIQKWNENGRLTLLWLYDDTLSGGIPANIGNLIYLDTLNLAYNQITGQIPESIGKLKNLDYLYLYYNQLSGIIPGTICNIFPNLSHFWIQYNFLCPPYPECLPEYEIIPQDTSQCPIN